MTAEVATDPKLSHSTRWHGSLDLGFAWRHDSTQLIRSQAQAPFKVQRPFYPEGAAVCHSVVLHTAGGMVGGDRLSSKIQLEPDAQALITTAAASKVYRSHGLTAAQTIEIQVGDRACLEWLPQETILFQNAQYQQTLRVELAPTATWLGWEITRLGRSARGEQFLSGEWRSRTEVWQQGRPLWIDPQHLIGSETLVQSPHALAGQAVVGCFALIGHAVEPELVNQARSLWQAGNYPGEAGVTRLMSGLLCRYRGPASNAARRWFMQVWQLWRSTYLGRDACPPRVWQL